MEKVATTHFICEPFHADFSGKLTMGVLGNHLLNCAGQHASARGFGMARLNEEDHTWVLSRMAIEFEELPKQYEHFEIDTWVENVYRLFTDRNFAIRNHEGRIIGYARTVWAMIGVQSRKPLDLTTLYNGTISAYSCTERECPIEKTGRFKMLVTEPALSYTARYSDIDINGHVNSMRYIEWKIRRALTPCTELRLTLENFIKMTHKTSWLTGQIKNGLYFLSLHVFRILSPESSIW